MVQLAVLLLGVLPFTCHASLSWPLLKAKFGGFNCNSQDGFYDMPLTETAASTSGLTRLSGCGDENRMMPGWAGNRYSDPYDHGVVLIYNINGDLAGVQSGINDTELQPPARRQGWPFHFYNGRWYLTYYFQEPSTICRHGSTYESRKRLFIQVGAFAWTSIEIPLDEPDAEPAGWYKGVCLPTMGQHYRYQMTRATLCSQYYPMFTMYNNGKLDGFGWTVMGNASSSYFEYPPVIPSPNTPDCLRDYNGTLTNLHFYLSSPCGRTCPQQPVSGGGY